MNFCTKCDNMYYLKISMDDPSLLGYYCRHCGNEEKKGDIGMCVLHTQLKKGDNYYQNIINEYTKEDPTLPRTNIIECPNPNCPKTKNEVLYIRYDEENMKYVYMCVVCDTKWKTIN